MKILHCCLAAFYVDDFGYQENILPKFHKKAGHDVEILASTETYIERTRLGYVSKGSYTNEHGIRVTRLPYGKWLPRCVARKMRIYSGLTTFLQTSRPDFIFLHDCQFVSIRHIVAYARKHAVRIVVDCHTDSVNSARSWLSRYLLHRVIYRWCAKTIEPVTSKFYGTLPLRVDFLTEMYGIAKDKIELLPFGADDSHFKWTERKSVRNQMREHLNLHETDTVFITGGKIDNRKNIHVLVDAFTNVVKRCHRDDLKLIVFGKPVVGMEASMRRLSAHPAIRHVEWVSPEELHKYFFASDVAVFPGTHSVLWEEAIGLGLPCIFLKWKGMGHLDLGGNCIFIENADVASIENAILRVSRDGVTLARMAQVALTKGPDAFSYSHIALRSIT